MPKQEVAAPAGVPAARRSDSPAQEDQAAFRTLSLTLSQRFMLRDTPVRVIEIAPPWVRTELMNSPEAEQAMPLEQFISEAIKVLGTEADEIIVEAAKPLRNNPGPGEHALVNGFNAHMLSLFAAQPSPAGQQAHG